MKDSDHEFAVVYIIIVKFKPAVNDFPHVLYFSDGAFYVQNEI